MKTVSQVTIIDGYNDEPAGLGVPPYLDVYARYTAGAVWTFDKNINVHYFTIDEIRENYDHIIKKTNKSEVVIIIAGMIVPGKYLGGKPIKPREVLQIAKSLTKPIKILGGPAARFGFGIEGGKRATTIKEIEDEFDIIVKGDLEIIVYNLLSEGLETSRVNPEERRRNAHQINKFAIKGAKIATDHPNYGSNLICEIETYRGCPRFIAGCCSFCAEISHGLPDFRSVKDIAEEIAALYSFGVRNFRLGRQPDIYSYMAHGVGEKEFPKLNPEAIRKLFSSIRQVAPNLKVLHIDNANPGAIYHHQKEAVEITKIIVKHHTSGDVAAFGVESADPRVIKANNLKACPEEVIKAIEIINSIGAIRGPNGLPELLPGINFVYGLIGETRETYETNLEFMREVMRRGLLVRRVNIRQCIPIPGTRMWNIGTKIIQHHKTTFKVYKDKMRREIDLPMLRKVAPTWTILKDVYLEKFDGTLTYGRQVGSYPILTCIPMKLETNRFIDVVVVDHGYRSITGLPHPIKINTLKMKTLTRIPGIGMKRAAKIMHKRPIKNFNELSSIIRDEELSVKLKKVIDFRNDKLISLTTKYRNGPVAQLG